jgi:hypothetical protein
MADSKQKKAEGRKQKPITSKQQADSWLKFGVRSSAFGASGEKLGQALKKFAGSDPVSQRLQGRI